MRATWWTFRSKEAVAEKAALVSARLAAQRVPAGDAPVLTAGALAAHTASEATGSDPHGAADALRLAPPQARPAPPADDLETDLTT